MAHRCRKTRLITIEGRLSAHLQRHGRWLPNALSFFRVALVPVWLLLAFSVRSAARAGGEPNPAAPILVWIAIGASDVLDGALARRFGLTTALGSTVDAIADKLAQVAAVSFLALLPVTPFTALPVWLLLSLALRDLLLAVGVIVIYRRHGQISTEHRWHGRTASLLLFLLVLCSLSGCPSPLILSTSVPIVLLVLPSTLAYLLAGSQRTNIL